jgi:hypothetical protein
VSIIRDSIVSEAMACADYSAADPATIEAFRALLGPGPWDLSVPFSCRKVDGRYVTRGVSTCGLVAAGILRRAGVRLPWIGAPYWHYPAPYTGLDIVSALTLLGQRTGSRRGPGERPVEGDVVCIGSGLATHVLTVVGWEGDVMVSVDGGQVEPAARGYLQCVRVCRRRWGVPRVVWTIDAVALFAALEAAEVYP